MKKTLWKNRNQQKIKNRIRVSQTGDKEGINSCF